MELNGIATIAVDTDGTSGETVAPATDPWGIAMQLASKIDDALARRSTCGGPIQNTGCVLGIQRDSDDATARCCRSLGCVDSHFDNAGTYESRQKIDRFVPVARGSDVKHSNSQIECGRARSDMRKRARKLSGNFVTGAATTILQCVRLNRYRHVVPAIVRAIELVAAKLPVAIKSSSRNAASLTAISGCQFHTA